MIITQRPGDTIILAPGVTITVCEIRDNGGKVRLGVQCPPLAEHDQSF